MASTAVVVSALVVLLLLAFPPHAIKAIAEATIMAEIMTFFIVLRFCCFLLLTTQGVIALHQILMRLFLLLLLCEPTPFFSLRLGADIPFQALNSSIAVDKLVRSTRS